MHGAWRNARADRLRHAPPRRATSRRADPIRGRHRALVALLALTALAILCGAGGAPPALAREHAESGLRADVAAADLPREAVTTLRRIRAGGPFPFERDGVTFGNRERRLPHEPQGYYHEYTVKTPGVHTRGARRIICGGAERTPDVCYYTADHYETFRRIRE